MTDTPVPKTVRRVHIAAILMFIGLAIELFSLFWAHPLAFVLFASLGMLAILAGLLIFLSTIFSPPVNSENGKQ